MKKLWLIASVGLITACALIPAVGPAPTQTPPPPSATEAATVTPPPTNTPRPTATHTPRPTPVPTWEPVAISELEAAFAEAGYRRFPFVTEDGTSGFTWVKDNAYEQVTTWEDGTIKLEILNDAARSKRAERMDRKLVILDTVLPRGFMVELRRAHEEYNQSVGRSVTGEANQIQPYNDEFQTVWAEYNATDIELGNYGVRISLWWWQSTCPGKYLYCYYGDFPGLEFTGDSSFVFYTILIWLPQPDSAASGST